ncbi:hypothetical protein [Deinococcus radiopugnans]|uniref:hypothetical protein n=1 Tax=Deinococcus radiopugnans TaxID=57497 RepID=UPI0012DFF259|nr:hypothetical protein [Deinococcus radiopugnans]
MKNELAEFLQFTSWKEFSSYYLPVSNLLERYGDLNLTDGITLKNSVIELEGLTRYVSQCLLRTKSDERTDTFVFDAMQWSETKDSDDCQILLKSLESAFEELQGAILSSTDEQLLDEGRPMWQPGGMSSPAEAILRLAFISSYRKGQLSVLLKDTP